MHVVYVRAEALALGSCLLDRSAVLWCEAAVAGAAATQEVGLTVPR